MTTENPDGCFIVFEGIDGAGTTTQAERYAACKALLDWMRRELAISAGTLDQARQEQLKRRSSQLLEGQWSLDEDEKLDHSRVVFPRSIGSSEQRFY